MGYLISILVSPTVIAVTVSRSIVVGENPEISNVGSEECSLLAKEVGSIVTLPLVVSTITLSKTVLQCYPPPGH